LTRLIAKAPNLFGYCNAPESFWFEVRKAEWKEIEAATGRRRGMSVFGFQRSVSVV